MKSKIACAGLVILGSGLLGCAGIGTTSTTVEDEPEAKFADIGNGICQDSSNGLMWAVQRSDFFSTWEDAREYADRLEYGGFSDWRLPTKKELYRLHDIFYWKRNGNCRMQTSGSYWSGAEGNGALAGYWETYYLCSPEYKYVETPGKGMVRTVRP